MSGGLSGEYYEDDMHSGLIPGRSSVARGQKALHRAGRTTDPWHHDIDESGDEEDIDVDKGAWVYQEGEDSSEEEGEESGYDMAGNAFYDGDDANIGRRGFRPGKGTFSRRRRRHRVGKGKGKELSKEKQETKRIRREIKRAKKKKATDRKDARKERRTARRNERFERGIAREKERQEVLKRELEGIGGGGGGEDLYEKSSHNLRYTGDILPARADSVTLSINGMLTAGKSVYDTKLGRAFFHNILGHDDDDFFDSREEAVDFLSEKFGLEFDDDAVEEHKYTGALTMYSAGSGSKRRAVAKLEPFTINPTLVTELDSIRGFANDADSGATTFEGGWKATLLAGATLHGVYGGEDGLSADIGDSMFYYETHMQDEDSQVPVIIHFESPSPVSMKLNDGKIQSTFDAQYTDFLHPDAETYNGIADRTIRLTPLGDSCKVHISTNVNFD